MGEDLYRISALWGARRETAMDIAGRMLSCFDHLRGVHPLFADWRDKWNNDEEWALGLKPPWRLDLKSLTELVQSYACGQSGQDELGFVLGGWTGGWQGDDEINVSFTMSAGKYAQFMVPNSIVMELPPPHLMPELYAPDVLRATVQAFIDAWDPWWASFASARLLDAQLPSEPKFSTFRELQDHLSGPGDRRAKMPTLGWLSYLDNRHFGPLPTAELAAMVQVIDEAKGTWLTFGGNPMDVSEQDVVALRKLVQQPFHAHQFRGVEKDPAFDFEAYRVRVLGEPHATMRYVVHGYAFDGHRDGKLLYVHPQYDFQAEKGELAPAQLKSVFLPLAQKQLAVGNDARILWYFPQEQVMRDTQAALAEWGIEAIHVKFIP